MMGGGIVSPDELELSDIGPGDLTQGGGDQTQSRANVNSIPDGNSPGKTFALTTPPFLQSPIFWATAVAILILVKILAEKAGQAEEFRTVKVGLENWFIVGLLAATFLYCFKATVAFIPSGDNWAMGLRQFAGLT